VPFEDYNVGADRDALKRLLDMGFRSTPVTVIGETKIAGYSQAKLDEALQAAGLV
jgi:protein-disulfide isomerase